MEWRWSGSFQSTGAVSAAFSARDWMAPDGNGTKPAWAAAEVSDTGEADAAAWVAAGAVLGD